MFLKNRLFFPGKIQTFTETKGIRTACDSTAENHPSSDEEDPVIQGERVDENVSSQIVKQSYREQITTAQPASATPLAKRPLGPDNGTGVLMVTPPNSIPKPRPRMALVNSYGSHFIHPAGNNGQRILPDFNYVSDAYHQHRNVRQLNPFIQLQKCSSSMTEHQSGQSAAKQWFHNFHETTLDIETSNALRHEVPALFEEQGQKGFGDQSDLYDLGDFFLE